jgi:broad specificity phosphatase PhoE
VALVAALGSGCAATPRESTTPDTPATSAAKATPASSEPTAAADPDTTTSPTLCVVRHAEAFKNLDPKTHPEVAAMSKADLDHLTAAGEAQAEALATRLPTTEVIVYASPAARAQETAERLQRGSVTVTEALRSLDGGPSLAAREAAWRRGEDPRPEGGESLADGALRVDALVDTLRDEARPGSTIVLVTHGDIAPLILGAADGAALLERPLRVSLPTGAMRCVALREIDVIVAPADAPSVAEP